MHAHSGPAVWGLSATNCFAVHAGHSPLQECYKTDSVFTLRDRSMWPCHHRIWWLVTLRILGAQVDCWSILLTFYRLKELHQRNACLIRTLILLANLNALSQPSNILSISANQALWRFFQTMRRSSVNFTPTALWWWDSQSTRTSHRIRMGRISTWRVRWWAAMRSRWSGGATMSATAASFGSARISGVRPGAWTASSMWKLARSDSTLWLSAVTLTSKQLSESISISDKNSYF